MTKTQLDNAVLVYREFIEYCKKRHTEQPVPYGVTCFYPCSPTDIKPNGDCREGCPLNKHCNTTAAIAAHKAAAPDCVCNDCLRGFTPYSQLELLPSSVALQQFQQQDLPF